MTARQHAQQLLDFIDNSPSPWHAAALIETAAKAFLFERLDETAKWQLQPGGRYYVVRDDSSIVLFALGRKAPAEAGFSIVGAHTDSPGLRLRPNPATASDGLVRLGVEIYGGPILATFTDRDLSLAGRISYVDDRERIEHTLVRFERSLLRLPNLAIHMNRGVNEDGLKLRASARAASSASGETARLIRCSISVRKLPAAPIGLSLPISSWSKNAQTKVLSVWLRIFSSSSACSAAWQEARLSSWPFAINS